MNITIYTKSNCPNCSTAKQLMGLAGLTWEEIEVERYPQRLRDMLKRHPEARQMPQIFINGQRVGGLAGLRGALDQMELL